MGRKRIDLTGKIFGKLTVVKFSGIRKKQSYWICKCECGNETIVASSNLTKGRTKTCCKNYFYKENDYMIGKTHNNKIFIFDILDYCEVSKYTWYIDGNNYVRTKISNKDMPLHNFIMKPNKNEIVDHINHNTLDNRKSELRICKKQENEFNCRKQANCSSKYKGVCWDKNKNKWISSIGYNNKLIHLGRYNNEIDAARAYNGKAKELFGEFAYLNDV